MLTPIPFLDHTHIPCVLHLKQPEAAVMSLADEEPPGGYTAASR